jgi:hypothetical protein
MFLVSSSSWVHMCVYTPLTHARAFFGFQRELPTPLLHSDVVFAILNAISSGNSHTDMCSRVAAILTEQLSAAAYASLASLMRLLARVVANEAETRMTIANIVIVMGPNLFV